MSYIEVIGNVLMYLYIFTWALVWVPGFIAEERHHPKSKAISELSMRSLLFPPLWLGALIWAYRKVDLASKLTWIENDPYHDREGAMRDYARALTKPDLIGDRVAWILGSERPYDEVVMRAREIASGPHATRIEALSQLLALIYHECPRGLAHKAYLAQTDQTRQAVDAAIEKAISDYLKTPESKLQRATGGS